MVHMKQAFKDTHENTLAVSSGIQQLEFQKEKSEQVEKDSQEKADQVTQRRVEFLEEITNDMMEDKLNPDDLSQEIEKMKKMFTCMVDQVMDGQIKVLNSDTVAKIMEQEIPLIYQEMIDKPHNPPKINTYTQIVESRFPDAPKSVQDQSIVQKQKKGLRARCKSIDDQSSLVEEKDPE